MVNRKIWVVMGVLLLVMGYIFVIYDVYLHDNSNREVQQPNRGLRNWEETSLSWMIFGLALIVAGSIVCLYCSYIFSRIIASAVPNS